MGKPQLFHCLRYTDADRGLRFLETLGFVQVLIVRDAEDETVVHHAQLKWRDNGGVMLGSSRAGEDDTPYRPGVCNLIVESDDAVDDLVAKAVNAGAALISPPANPPHGGRAACVADFDGNYWNLDSYPGE